jgi:hypothetical protein
MVPVHIYVALSQYKVGVALVGIPAIIFLDYSARCFNPFINYFLSGAALLLICVLFSLSRESEPIHVKF